MSRSSVHRITDWAAAAGIGLNTSAVDNNSDHESQSIDLIRNRGTDGVSRYSIFEIPSTEIQTFAPKGATGSLFTAP
jgi:hypothetical protein